MRTIPVSQITDAVKEMCIEANLFLTKDMEEALKQAQKSEEAPLGRSVLDQLCQNLQIAGEDSIPICQDTGMAVVFIEAGQNVHLKGGSLEDAVNEGRVAVHAYSRFDDLVEFALGNVPAGVSVGVEVKVSCFCSAGSDGHSMFVKFPFHVNTSSSYGESLMKLIRNEFKFTFDCSRAGDQIKTVTSNAKNGVYNQQRER